MQLYNLMFQTTDINELEKMIKLIKMLPNASVTMEVEQSIDDLVHRKDQLLKEIAFLESKKQTLVQMTSQSECHAMEAKSDSTL